MRRLVLASGNAGKLREFRALLAPLEVQVISQAELAIESAAEPYATFVENALAKARHASAASGLPALADDSGLSCPALGGLPGVRSARFAGDGASDGENNAALLRRMAGAADIAEARWHGQIIEAPRGTHGFGYDPHFLLPELGRTAAELDPDHKNRISHRGQAMAELARRLAVHWGW